MNAPDQTPSPEERIQRALTHGPDVDAPGRYGMLTRFVRRFVGRAVKYERDYGLQIDVALLDRLHEVEESFARQLHDVSTQLRESHQSLHEFDEQLLDNDHRAQRHAWEMASRVEALESMLAELRSRLQDTDSRAAVAHGVAAGAADGLESIARKASFAYDELTSRPYIDAQHPLFMTDSSGRARLAYRGASGSSPLYIGFEDIFRGSETLIQERQRVYLGVVADRGPVVDLGCGRGEMLGLLSDAGIEATGVDIDEAMVDHARARGVNVERGDALEFLVKQEDASLGAIFSAQFIEHLPAGLLPELLEVARAKLSPNGVFVAETVNPHSPRALKAFWIDPTHQHPLFPETMLALCRLTGFEEGEIMFPLGRDDLETDLRTCGEYAVVARGRALA